MYWQKFDLRTEMEKQIAENDQYSNSEPNMEHGVFIAEDVEDDMGL